MSRPIKFRAWDKRNNRMLLRAAPSVEHGGHHHYNDNGSFRIISEDDSVLMQFTGLQDKNGKEIFEGDILRLEIILGQITMKIEWDSLRAQFVYHVINDKENFLYPVHGIKNWKIIGNIWDNPELLEGVK